MCQVCDYIIFRLQQEFDLAMSRQERDKVETLGSLIADAHIAIWAEKEGITYKSEVPATEAEKEADRESERQELWQPGDEPYEPDYWGAYYE